MQPNRFWKLMLVSVVAIALPLPAIAQNQSDVTGPNLSDVTGPNLSDVTGPNQSDITGIVNEEIFETAAGDFVNLADFFQNFFDTYGEELGLDPDASLAANLRRVNQVCSAEKGGTRRFARTPGSSVQPVSMACTEFSQLVQSAKQSLEKYKLLQPQSADGRVW